MVKSILKLLSSLISLCVLVSPAKAVSSPSYSFTAASIYHDPFSYVLGIRFTPNSDVAVTALGYFDNEAYGAKYSGLLTSHDVGIFDDAGALLISATVDAGNSDPLAGYFRYKSVAPLIIRAGHEYTMAGVTVGNVDSYAYGVDGSSVYGFQVNQMLTIAHYAVYISPGGVLTYPTEAYPATIYAGPNLLIQAIPEPAMASLSIVGLICIGILVRRKRKKEKGRWSSDSVPGQARLGTDTLWQLA